MAETLTSEPTAGESTCPICGRTWTVTPSTDCLLPACGCYGFDVSEANPHRTCEPCGFRHSMTCRLAPPPQDRPLKEE